MTTSLTQKEQSARKLAHISLFFLPIYGFPAAFFIGSPGSLGYVLTVAGILLHITFAILSWFTRDRAPAIVAILMPFATFPLMILGYLFSIADSMRLY